MFYIWILVLDCGLNQIDHILGFFCVYSTFTFSHLAETFIQKRLTSEVQASKKLKSGRKHQSKALLEDVSTIKSRNVSPPDDMTVAVLDSKQRTEHPPQAV